MRDDEEEWENSEEKQTEGKSEENELCEGNQQQQQQHWRWFNAYEM